MTQERWLRTYTRKRDADAVEQVGFFEQDGKWWRFHQRVDSLTVDLRPCGWLAWWLASARSALHDLWFDLKYRLLQVRYGKDKP